MSCPSSVDPSPRSRSPHRSQLARILSLVALCLPLAVGVIPAASSAAELPPGLVAEPPSEGPSVKTSQGYMVPYQETIPGTDVQFTMLPIPGGEFLLGSSADEAERKDDEGPQVKVTIAPFWMGKCEVTWAEYRSYMACYQAFKRLQQLRGQEPPANAPEQVKAEWNVLQRHGLPPGASGRNEVDAVTSPTPLYDSSYTYGAGEADEQPAVTMTHYAARQYTKWLSRLTGRQFRLPTEAEWEYAARAGSTTAYSFGDDPAELEQYAWFDDNADYETHPVGTKAPNAWGLHDMHGNAAEWTLDQYHADAYERLAPGPVDAAAAVQWPEELYPRVIRGGCWFDTAEWLRSAARHRSEEDEWKLSDPNAPLSPWWYTEDPSMGVGMRLVRPLAPLASANDERLWEADVEDLRFDVETRLDEGRGALGVADPDLPRALELLRQLDR